MARYLALLLLLFSLQASAAHNESLSWTLAEPPDATGFIVNWATAGGIFTAVDALRPTLIDGAFTYDITVPDEPIYFYVVGYNAGGSGPGSNQICRLNGLPCPASPPPPPPPDPPRARINGFALWNAATGTVAMGNFSSGHSFDPGCYAIEIRGNKYLRQNNGSIRKYFDGQLPASNACENMYAFGWEDGGTPGVWVCANSLTLGIHTLKVEAFNEKNCQGAISDTREITFGVGVVPEPPIYLSVTAGILTLIFLGRRRAATR